MNDISEKIISLYHNLFLVCLILALVFFALAVILFFVLDIRTVWALKSGRHRKKAIKKLEESTALSGRLKQKERTNMQYVAQEMKDDMGVRQKARPGIRKVEHAVEAAAPITAEMPAPQTTSEVPTSEDTAVLSNDSGTEVLQENMMVQSVTEIAEDVSTGAMKNGDVVVGKFVIVKDLMMIHTEEVI